MRIAVILPTRGMMFSQTAEELLENLEGFNYEIYWSHGLPIPDCFNYAAQRALRNSKNTHFFFIEEDMILPKDTLKNLLKAKVPAICCDYPVTKEGKASVLRDPDGNVIYGGTGCLLVASLFLKKYKQPVFRTDIAWDIKIDNRFEATPRKIEGNIYGLHDVTFGLQAYWRGEPIQVSKIRCGQRKLRNLGASATNIGQHSIETWTDLKIETLDLYEPSHQNVKLNDGTLVYMDIFKAREMEKEGKLTIPSRKYVQLIENKLLKELI